MTTKREALSEVCFDGVKVSTVWEANCDHHIPAVMGNFFNGQIGKFELASGQMIASAETEVERSVAGIAEFS